MVNFNPNIYYSDKASEAKERYQEAKKRNRKATSKSSKKPPNRNLFA